MDKIRRRRRRRKEGKTKKKLQTDRQTVVA
jgi:hypothetical protein